MIRYIINNFHLYVGSKPPELDTLDGVEYEIEARLHHGKFTL
jgi:hypothetical protein